MDVRLSDLNRAAFVRGSVPAEHTLPWNVHADTSSVPLHLIRVVRCPMALAVGVANSEVRFVFPTSEEMGHPSFDASLNTSARAAPRPMKD